LLPPDGTLRSFVLSADRSDAWTRIKNQRIGTIYLSRDDSGGEPRVTAFSATCPHLGCVVDFDASAKRFACPCHEAAFAIDGSRVSGPSKRGLDVLAVELRDGAGGAKDVYVAYVTYLPGIAERTPLS
jgi:Rieske Fe-S protein